MKRESLIWMVIVGAGVSWYIYESFIKPPPPPTKRAVEFQQAREEHKTKWAEAGDPITIGEGETIRRVKIYTPPVYFPIVCYVYTHQQFKSSNMVCPSGEIALDD